MEGLGFQDVSELMGSGIYILRMRGVVVYVGQAQAMLLRLYSHYYAKRYRGRKKMKWMSFDEMWIRPWPRDKLNELEKELIQEFAPRYNVRHVEVPLDVKALIESIVTRPKFHPTIGPIERRL